jgi:hypothetical protein
MYLTPRSPEQTERAFNDLLEGLLARRSSQPLTDGHLGAGGVRARAFVPWTAGLAPDSTPDRQRKDVLSTTVQAWSLTWTRDLRFKGSFTLPRDWKPAAALEGGVAIVVLQRHSDALASPVDENHIYSEVITKGVVNFDYLVGEGPPRDLPIPQDCVREILLYAPHWWTAPTR